MDYTVHGVTESRTRLSDFISFHFISGPKDPAPLAQIKGRINSIFTRELDQWDLCTPDFRDSACMPSRFSPVFSTLWTAASKAPLSRDELKNRLPRPAGGARSPARGSGSGEPPRQPRSGDR